MTDELKALMDPLPLRLRLRLLDLRVRSAARSLRAIFLEGDRG